MNISLWYTTFLSPADALKRQATVEMLKCSEVIWHHPGYTIYDKIPQIEDGDIINMNDDNIHLGEPNKGGQNIRVRIVERFRWIPQSSI